MSCTRKILEKLGIFDAVSHMPLRKRMALDYINFVRRTGRVDFYQPTYNPNNFPLHKVRDFIRQETDLRLDTIIGQFDFTNIHSYLDIGSQFGYFVFKVAECKKVLATGIEMDRVLCAYSNAIIILNDLENISFTNCKLTPEVAQKLPMFDLISFLNVFHHLVHFDGFQAADQTMRILRDKCRYFVFETGQYNEKGYYWTDDLKFMGSDPDAWITEYIRGLGYTILCAKHFKTHLSDNTRSFLSCERLPLSTPK